LAEEFNVSRATISSWIGQLGDYGLHVNKVQGRGYRLQTPISLLNKCEIEKNLGSISATQFSVINIVSETSSTNELAMQSTYSDERWQLFAAEFQFAGRGRRGKVWQSPYGSSLLFTLGLKKHWPTEVLYFASMLAGLGLAEVISELVGNSAEVQVKWPNDVYVNGQKMAGVLCELQGSPVDEALLVVGIGINVSCSPESVDNPAAKVKDYVDSEVDRNSLLANVCAKLVACFDQALSGEVDQLLTKWQYYDYLLGKRVKVLMGSKAVFGVASGVNGKGELRLALEDGSVRCFNGGEVSVRW
jgi:BirA family biotin operon repressor/biotin-[acetyl-CoA-carboxylase] ligase